MSRKLIGDSELSTGEKEHRYASKPSPYADLVEDLAQHYISLERSEDGSYILLEHPLSNRLERRIRKEVGDAQRFLDDVTEELLQEGDAQLPRYQLNHALTSILFDEGHNQFFHDYDRHPAHLHVAKRLQGKTDDPLVLRASAPRNREPGMNIDLLSVGQEAQHCDITLKGKARDVGTYASHCTFRLETPPNAFGRDAMGCTYYLYDVERVVWGNDGSLSFPLSLTLTHRSGKHISSLHPSFYEQGNRLLVPKGDAWRELYVP